MKITDLTIIDHKYNTFFWKVNILLTSLFFNTLTINLYEN